MKAGASVVVLLCCVSLCMANVIYISPFGSSRGDGTKGSPLSTLGDAITKATSNDVIVVQQGLYSGPGNKAVSLPSNKVNVTIMGESGPDQSIFWCEGSGSTALTVSGGGANIVGLQFASCSRGVYVAVSSINITNCIFSQNTDAGVYGDTRGYTSVLVSHCKFEGNTHAVKFDRSSGSIIGNITVEWSHIFGHTSNPSRGVTLRRFESVNIIRTHFTDLATSNAYGTAIFTDTGDVLIQFCNFTSNVGLEGGAIAAASETTIDNCYLHRNVANRGGGIRHTAGVLRLTNTELTHNVANKDYGGGVYSNANLNMQNVQIIHNVATKSGGGAYFDSSCAANARSVTFSHNNGTVAGGGFTCAGAAVNLFDSVVSDNVSDELSSTGWQCTGTCRIFKTNTRVINNTAEC